MADRLSAGEWVAGAGAALLVVSLFAPWERKPRPGTAEMLIGWRSFGPVAVALVVVAGVPLWHAARRLGGRRGLRPLASVCAGAVGVTLVLFGMATRLDVGSRPQWGLYVGLLAAAAVTIGGSLHLWDARPPAAPRV